MDPGQDMLPVRGMPRCDAFRTGKAMVHSKDAAGRFTWSDRLGPHGSTIETKRCDSSWNPKNGHSKPNFFWKKLQKECIASGNWHPELEARPSFEMGGVRVKTDHLRGLAATESERSAQVAQIAIAQESRNQSEQDKKKQVKEFLAPAPSDNIEDLYRRPAAVVALKVPVTSPLKVPRAARRRAAQNRADALASSWSHMPLPLLRGKMHGPIDIRREGIETTVKCLQADVVAVNSAGGSYRTKYWADEPMQPDVGRVQSHPGTVQSYF